MKPGDVVTCSSCSAQAVAEFSSGRWQEGWPLALAWTHGPHERVEVTHVAPAECIWCHELHQAMPGAEPRYRPAPAAAGQVRADLARLRAERQRTEAALLDLARDGIDRAVRPREEEPLPAPYAPPVPCPSCRAGAGEPCRTGTGKSRAVPHLPRQDEDLDARERARSRRAAAPAGQLALFGGTR